MGTRADFYVGVGEQAEWLGSIAWDGYPDGLGAKDRTDSLVLAAQDEGAYRSALHDFLAARDDSTLPERGWPWPWDTSGTTDYAYAALAAAGRIQPIPWPFHKRGCTYDSWDHDDGRDCGEPVAGSMRRTDIPATPRLRACRDHLIELGVRSGLPMRVTWHCSVCLRRVDAGYRLDASGRCRKCQP